MKNRQNHPTGLPRPSHRAARRYHRAGSRNRTPLLFSPAAAAGRFYSASAMPPFAAMYQKGIDVYAMPSMYKIRLAKKDREEEKYIEKVQICTFRPCTDHHRSPTTTSCTRMYKRCRPAKIEKIAKERKSRKSKVYSSSIYKRAQKVYKEKRKV